MKSEKSEEVCKSSRVIGNSLDNTKIYHLQEGAVIKIKEDYILWSYGKKR